MSKCHICKQAKNDIHFNYHSLMCDKCWKQYDLHNANNSKIKLIDDTLHMLEKQKDCLHHELYYSPIDEKEIYHCVKCLKEFTIQEYKLNKEMPYQLDLILNYD